jgi:hypothetical protein
VYPEINREIKRKVQDKYLPPVETKVSYGQNEEQVVFRKNYAQEFSITLGFLLITFGLVELATSDLTNSHLTYTMNLIHLFSGVLALIFGFIGKKAAKTYSSIIGLSYFLFGVLGFIKGINSHALFAEISKTGSFKEDNFWWRLFPEVIELGTSDHLFHIATGVIFLIGFGMVISKHSPKL